MAIPKPSVAMYLGGQWVDVSADLLRRDGGINLSRGRRARGARTDPARATFTLKGERYSTRNPYSDLYGTFGRLSPTRITVPGTEAYLDLPGTATGMATTPDHAALDIVGDLDIRAEVTVDWAEPGPQTLIGKWGAAGGRSYLLMLDSGSLAFRWSPDGATTHFASLPLPTMPRRAAVRATLDVDNGAAGRTVRLYWATSLAGPWTQIGADIVTASVTSVFNSSSALALGPADTTTSPQRLAARGRIHRAEVRSGIGGTVVAAPDLRALAEGTTGWTDSAGRAWTVVDGAEVTRREYRAALESTASSTRSHASGHDVHTPVTASGILQRLSEGSRPVQSTLRRRIPSEPTLVAYWPMEEGEDADRIVSPLAGVPDLRVTGMDLGSDDSMPGSDALPRLRTPSSLRGLMPAVVSAGWQLELVYYLDQMPASSTELIRVHVAGSEMWRAEVLVSTAEVRVRVVAPDGTIIGNAAYTNAAALTDFVGRWNRLQLFTAISGGTAEVTASWRDVTGTTRHYATAGYTGTSAGRPTFVAGDWSTSALDGLRLGHVAMFQGVNGTLFPAASAPVTIFEGADDGFARETAINRLARLAGEESATLDVTWRDGDASRASEAMGPQRVDTLVSLLEQVPETDGGILYERRDRLGLEYRDRATLYNQTPTLVLDYTARHIAPPLEPAERAVDVVNDVTVQRIGGSAGRAVIGTGPLSVQPPPDGVGVKDQQVSVSAGSDGQLEQLAAWRASLGTYDGAHFVQVKVLLHAAPELIPSVLATDVGDVIRLTSLPYYQSPDSVDLIVEGYTERWPSPLEWEITYTCSPGGPWVVGVLEDPVLGRLDTDGAVLGAAATQSATTLEVHTDTAVGPRWIDSATYPTQFPFSVQFGGERATCTAVVNRADSFTRTQSNGWGTASSGQAWAETAGTAADRSVNGSRGVIVLSPAVSTVRFQRLVTAAVADAEVRVRMSVSAVATGASAIPAVLLRYVDAATFYRARVHFGTGGGMFVSISRDTTQIGGSPALPYTYTAGAEYEVRVRLVGHTIQMRVWPVGQAEPPVWHHTETVVTNPITAGGIGVTGSAFAGLTNVGMELRFDQFEVVTPQLMTVTRSVNGIVKPHAAGTPLSLSNPMRLAL
ncbi:hypothetical protein ACF068_14495 [Streptomyces sp. NPDC016309]|uniref:hypothetical protein n=1 Tax=Streptomyces sp. NPDC016309 TaxID=3364965 RepID=UPI0036FDCA48